MPHRVIHVLEAVQVHEQHADGARMPARLIERLAQPVIAQDAVGKIGQMVVLRLAQQLRLRLRARGDVLHHHHHEVRFALRVAHQRDG
jgi:hypothetical protein